MKLEMPFHSLTLPYKKVAHVAFPSTSRIQFGYLISFRLTPDSMTNKFSIFMILFNEVSFRLVSVAVLNVNSLWGAVYLGMSCY